MGNIKKGLDQGFEDIVNGFAYLRETVKLVVLTIFVIEGLILR